MDEIKLNMLCFTMGRSDISVKKSGLGPALELMGNKMEAYCQTLVFRLKAVILTVTEIDSTISLFLRLEKKLKQESQFLMYMDTTGASRTVNK